MLTTIELIPADKTEGFVVPIEIAKHSTTIKNLLDDIETDERKIFLPNVKEECLKKVIEFITYKHHNPPIIDNTKEVSTLYELTEWDKNFFKLDIPILDELLRASSYLDIKLLLEATSKTIAEIIKSYNVEELRLVFGYVNDFTPEEYEKVKRKQEEWIESN